MSTPELKQRVQIFSSDKADAAPLALHHDEHFALLDYWKKTGGKDRVRDQIDWLEVPNLVASLVLIVPQEEEAIVLFRGSGVVALHEVKDHEGTPTGTPMAELAEGYPKPFQFFSEAIETGNILLLEDEPSIKEPSNLFTYFSLPIKWKDRDQWGCLACISSRGK